MSSLAEKILKLRSDGMTYTEIQQQLGCSLGTISYHLGEGQKEKTKKRSYLYRKDIDKVLNNKTWRFHQERPTNPRVTPKIERPVSKIESDKIRDFCREHQTKQRINFTFTYADVKEKFQDNPTCYLTGDKLDLTDPKSFHFDHIVPISRGGSNDINNLGLATAEANKLKGNLTLDELLTLCEKILAHHGRLAETDEPQLDNRQPIQ